MTLEEAIEHLKDSLANKEFSCDECYMEHRQLLAWLIELQKYRKGEKMNVKKAFAMLNETLHPNGFHAAMVSLDMMCFDDLFGGDGNGDAYSHLIKQTYDFRYYKPDKKEYTVTLSAKDMEYISRAMELYKIVCVDRYEKEVKQAFKRGILTMSEEGEKHGQ